jgi:menaquinol-cytochrome c reductase iron-sulfur subunit
VADDSRRGFLKAASLVLAALAGAVAAVPVLGSVLTPLLRKQKDVGGFLPACSVDDLFTGVPKRVDLIATVVDGWSRTVGVAGAVWLLKKPDGKIEALSTVCPHSGCSINAGGKDTYACPCHASAFALDGVPLTGPSPRPMDPLQVEVREKQIFVKYVRYKMGTKDRQEI